MWRWLAFALAALVVLAVVAMVGFGVHQGKSKWQQLTSPGPLSKVHAFIGNNCAACHSPITGVTRAKCVTCHADDTELVERQPTAFHQGISECASCHYEHVARIERPIHMDHAALARIGLAELSQGRADMRRLRGWLAAWMRSAPAPDMRGSLSAEERLLDCASCHRINDVHSGNFGQNCALCHGTKNWFIETYVHPSPSSRQCAQCHRPSPCHFMEGCLVMMGHMAGGEGARLEQCYRCHKTTSWYDFRRPPGGHH
jgi:cytochrome c3-like protein